MSELANFELSNFAEIFFVAMQITTDQGKVCVRTPCKVNPFLEVLSRRPDGYHDLDTLMVAVDLYDELEFSECEGSNWHLSVHAKSAWIQQQIGYNGDRLGDVHQNLVWKALGLLSRELGIHKGLCVKLQKSIPVQAGLGGGSSDAAAALVAAQWMWTGHYDHELACRLASQLGSDINFFLEGFRGGAWVAACLGRGEKVQPIKAHTNLNWLLVCPAIGCNTGTVFRSLELGADAPRSLLNENTSLDGDLGKSVELERVLFNRLFNAAIVAYPDLGVFYDRLRNIAPQLQFTMSGSGSTFFTICEREIAIRVSETIEQQLNCFTYVGNCWKTRSIAEQIDDLTLQSAHKNNRS